MARLNIQIENGIANFNIETSASQAAEDQLHKLVQALSLTRLRYDGERGEVPWLYADFFYDETMPVEMLLDDVATVSKALLTFACREEV